jgi:hypothetical protein
MWRQRQMERCAEYPISGSRVSLRGNLDLLKEAGCPDDWNSSPDKVRECAISIKTKFPDKYGIAFRTAGLANFSQHDWYGYIMRAGGDYLNEDFTACGLNKPEVVQTLQWLVDLQNTDKVTPEFGASPGMACAVCSRPATSASCTTSRRSPGAGK